MEHAHWIIARYKSLDDMDTPSAEVTAKLVNAGKISPGMYIFERSFPAKDYVSSRKTSFRSKHRDAWPITAR